MNHPKYFSLIVAAVLGLYGLVGFYFMPLASFEGDLTRMAKLPESFFGWTNEQPVINPAFMQQAEWKDAEVLAIGDSFTNANIWQTVFTEKGVKVRSESWSSMFNICEDISDWLMKKGFKGKYVIIESAEKYHEVRLSQSLNCKQTIYHPIAELLYSPPITLPDRITKSYSGSMSVGIQTKINSFRYEQLSSKSNFASWDTLEEVRMVHMENGCKLFSHNRCNDVLFYKKDRIEDMGEKIFYDMSKINERLKGYTTVWVIIPDKATVYLQNNKIFWNEAERKFKAPNLLNSFKQALAKNTIDLYLANNTHVSTTGYILMGNAIYNSMYH